MTSKIEFAVQMKCNKCVNSIHERLSSTEGINQVKVSLENELVVVETTLPTQRVQEIIESTGRRAVVKGYGDGKNASAVAMVGGVLGSGLGSIRGVVRFSQINPNLCVIDGTLDGLPTGSHGLHIHECGDISQGCGSIGAHYNPENTRHGGPDDDKNERHAGDLGNIVADIDGRATFRITDNVVKVWDIIGRSIAVAEGEDDLGRSDHPHSHMNGNSGASLACGVIARSAGLFENIKRICACDGVTLWDERDRPVAGPGRRENGKISNL